MTAACRTAAVSPDRTASFIRASARSTSRRARTTGYGRVGYNNGALKLNFFANYIDADAPNLLLAGPTGAPLQLNFSTQTYDFEAGDAFPLGQHHVLSVGGNVRRNNFNITIAPNAENRTELGAYVQDEISRRSVPLHARRPGGQVREPERSGLFSAARGDVQADGGPCRALLVQPRVQVAIGDQQLPRHQHRRSHGPERAGAAAAAAVEAAGGNAPFPLTVRAVGSRLPIGTIAQDELVEESLTAYEIAYNATVGRTTFGAAFYVNDMDDQINFSQLPTNLDPYTAANPPPGWPLPPSVLTGDGGERASICRARASPI